MTTGRINQGSRFYNNCVPATDGRGDADPRADGDADARLGTRASERRSARGGGADAEEGRTTATGKRSRRTTDRGSCGTRARANTRARFFGRRDRRTARAPAERGPRGRGGRYGRNDARGELARRDVKPVR